MYKKTTQRARLFTAGVLYAMILALLSSCSPTPPEREDRDPEAATGLTNQEETVSDQYMVSAANQYASESGSRILALGRNAIDAAVSVQMVLNLVEPQSSGIGGGAFLLYWDQSKKELVTFDGRETAPSSADSTLFHGADGKPMKWIEAVVGGRSVGVPGVLKMFEKAHTQYGNLPWATLFEDAIKLAEKGFVVSPRLEKLVAADINPGMKRAGNTRDYFFPKGQAIQAEQTLTNPKLAEALKMIAAQGTSAFYQGDIAKQIIQAVNNDRDNPGQLSLQDLSNYEAQTRPPVCADYRGYKVCGMGPPSPCGLTVLQRLQILIHFTLPNMEPLSTESNHINSPAMRPAFAARHP